MPRTGRCRHRPLQTLCGFAGVRSGLRVCTAGRTGSSAPTGAYHFALVHSKFATVYRAGGVEPRPYANLMLWCKRTPVPRPGKFQEGVATPSWSVRGSPRGDSKLPLAVFLYTASGAFFPHGKKGGLSPHRCTAPCKSAKRGDTIQTRNRRAGQAPPLRYDETRYSSKTTASDPVSQLR